MLDWLPKVVHYGGYIEIDMLGPKASQGKRRNRLPCTCCCWLLLAVWEVPPSCCPAAALQLLLLV